MKTQYFRRHRSRALFSSGAGVALAVFVVFILVILCIRLFFPGVLTAALTPLWQLGAITSKAVALPENPTAVRLERDQLAAKNRELANENEALRARLRDVGAETELPTESGVLAGVLARPPLSPYDTLVLGAGTDDGVYVNGLVYAEGVPVGTIAEASRGFSRVILFSAPGRTTEGWVGDERLPITLRGAGSGAFEADVARDSVIAEGNMVYLPGPGAVPAGTVITVERHEASPRATVRIQPLANPFSITWVRVKSPLE